VAEGRCKGPRPAATCSPRWVLDGCAACTAKGASRPCACTLAAACCQRVPPNLAAAGPGAWRELAAAAPGKQEVHWRRRAGRSAQPAGFARGVGGFQRGGRAGPNTNTWQLLARRGAAGSWAGLSWLTRPRCQSRRVDSTPPLSCRYDFARLPDSGRCAGRKIGRRDCPSTRISKNQWHHPIAASSRQ
jgi:hypothetical protein